MNRDLTGTLLVLLSTAGYAFFSILSKMAIQAGITPITLAVWRFILAAAMFWASFPFWRKFARLPTLKWRDYATMLFLGVVFTGGALTAFYSLNTGMPASTYTLLVNTSTAMVVLLSVALGERLPLWSWAAVGLALVGTALTMQGNLAGVTFGQLMLPILNAAFIAVYIVLAARLTPHIPGITTGIFVITGALGTLLVIGAVMGIGLPPVEAWGPVLGIALFSTVIGIAALLAAMNYIPAARASLIQSSGPPATLIFASLILGDRLSPLQYVGGALILVSVFLAHLRDRSAKPEIEAVVS